MNHDIDTLVGRITPVTDARAAELLTGDTAADLARRITATAAADEPAPARTRRMLTVGLPMLGTGLVGAAVAVALVAQPAGPGGPERPAPSQAVRSPGAQGKVTLVSALSFSRKGGYLDVRVRDPYADPKRYKAEFAKHGLDVNLSLVPASPSIVGTVVMQETSEGTRPGDVTDIRVKGACEVASGGNDCTVGVRVRTGYKGTATIVFGRAARKGEQYNSTAKADAPGESMHGMVYRKQRLSKVLAALRKRNVTVPEYRVMVGNQSKARYPGQVPENWYVHDAVPWADGQVMLFVGPKPTEEGTPAAPPPTVAPGSSAGN